MNKTETHEGQHIPPKSLVHVPYDFVLDEVDGDARLTARDDAMAMEGTGACGQAPLAI